MNNDEQKIGLGAVIIVSLIISVVVAAFLFSVRNGIFSMVLPEGFFEDISEIFYEFFPQKRPTMDALLSKGKPTEVLDMISNQPDSVQRSDTTILMRGKAWYLIAWQRFENERWSSYAKNENDWFIGEDIDSALTCFAIAAKSENTWAEATTLIGAIYMEKGWFEKAKNVFHSILERDRTQQTAFLDYGIALSRLGHYESAVRHLEKWDDYLNDSEFLKNLFWLYLFNLKDYEKAAVLGDLFLRIAPKGDMGITRIKRELIDLSARFPEYFNDTMIVIIERPREFAPRKR
jgi:tetratricopeptide (TPR) repeat protein